MKTPERTDRKSETGKKQALADQNGSAAVHVLRIVVTALLLVAVGVGIFGVVYGHYNDRLLYAERLSQMQDVTTQLFSGLENVVGNQWDTVDVLCNYMELAQPATQEALQRFMEKQAALNELSSELDSLIAVDGNGRYYTQEGIKGTLQELNYLLDDPARISFVSNTVTTNYTKMVFLKRLEQPVQLEGTEILYYGFTRDMGELEPYFRCAAYGDKSSVCVMDNDGLKLFSSSGSGGLIKGYNVYRVLEGMEYRHGSSFQEAKKQLEENGLVYSNAVLGGEEYFYALYRMDSAEWTLAFLVNSSAVALNTVELVNMTVHIVLVFAVFMACVCSGAIFWMQRRQQKKELALVEKNSAELAKLNKELEAASKAKSDFLANMSHDIRTPMNAIVGIANLMEHEEGTSEKLHDYIHKVQFSSRHLLSLINDILDMSKIEANDVTLSSEPVSVADQVAQVVNIIQPQAVARQQDFQIYTHDIVHEYILGDGVRLRQMLINLLSNAVKYTQMGGTIRYDLWELPCEKEGCMTLKVAVTDNGCGMTPEFVEHIFEPFTRAENSTTNKVQGTGLGMAITKNIVDLMDGTITVQSEVGKGSCFEVTLTHQIDKNGDRSVGADHVLLITGDQEAVRNISASMKERDARFSVVSDSAEAEAFVKRECVDVILLGEDLCGKGAQDTVRLLREASKSPLFLLGCGLAWQKPEEEEKAAVDGVIGQPFFGQTLHTAIERLRSRTGQSRENGVSMLAGMRFLCAEDNELNAEILEELLEMNGASCVICPDGTQVFKTFMAMKVGEYDAILMDIQIPKMNGLAATIAIRSSDHPLAGKIPIIAMTANAFNEDVRDCMSAGMDAHVSKPIDMEVLEQTIKEVLRKKTAG